MGRLEKALERLNEAIDRVESVAGALRDREMSLRAEASETVGAALAELRRAAAEMEHQGDDADG